MAVDPPDAARTSTHVVFDDSAWPVSRQRLPVHWTDQTIAELRDEVTKLLARRERYAAVLEFAGIPRIDALRRRQAAEIFREHGEDIGRYCLGVAIVASSPMIRGLHTAVRWIVPAPHEEICLSTRGEAMAWARDVLHRHGVT